MVVVVVVRVVHKRKKMTLSQKEYKKKLIQKIQISKNNVFNDDESRREFMLSRFGVDSTTKLTIDELKLLLDFCNRNVSDVPFSKPTEAQLKYIYENWYEKARNKSLESLDALAFKVTKKEMINLTRNDATKLIQAVKNLKA